MTSIEVLDVALSEVDPERLRGRNIEAPTTQSRIDGDTIVVVGWVLGRSSPAVTVEVVHEGKVLQSAPIDVQRPDITDAFPGVPGAQQSGFRTNVAVPNSEEFEFLVRAALQDKETTSLGVIRARLRRSGEEQYGESSVQDQSGPLTRLLRGVLGRGGG
jgi:O-antigen biosynthesis protein